MSPKRANLFLKIGLGAVIVLSVIGIYFANLKLTTVAKETARLKAQVEVGQKQVTIYEQTQSKIKSLSYVDTLADKVLPATQDQSQVVAELSDFALHSNLNVAQISFSDVSATDKKTTAAPGGVTVSPISVQLQAGARYNDLLNFLEKVEQNRRKMQVTNISLAPDAKDRTKLNQVTIILSMYSKKAS